MIIYDKSVENRYINVVNDLNKKEKQLEMIIKHLISENNKLRSQNNKIWKEIEKNV